MRLLETRVDEERLGDTRLRLEGTSILTGVVVHDIQRASKDMADKRGLRRLLNLNSTPVTAIALRGPIFNPRLGEKVLSGSGPKATWDDVATYSNVAPPRHPTNDSDGGTQTTQTGTLFRVNYVGDTVTSTWSLARFVSFVYARMGVQSPSSLHRGQLMSLGELL